MSIKKSFSLIEVLVFVTILSLFLVIAAAVVTVSMRQNTLRINTLRATHYNEQLLDWIRNEKEVDWNAFALKAGNGMYCFESDNMLWPDFGVLTKDDCPSTLGTMYKRYAKFVTTLLSGAPNQVEVTVYTEWQEAGNTHSTQLQTVFSVWE